MKHRANGERREFPRRAGEGCEWATLVRLRPGRDVLLLDLSARGASIEAPSRLLPGTHVELQLGAPGWHWMGRAHVLRCHVSALAPQAGIRYRAALHFDRHLDVPSADALALAAARADGESGPSGYLVPAAKPHPGGSVGSHYPNDRHLRRHAH